MKIYPLFKVHVNVDSALANIKDVLTGGYINEGVQVTQLTDALRGVLGTDNLVLVNSCTSALTMALKLAGVGPGDEVISTPMTCVATNTPILNLGASVVWADIDPMTGMIEPENARLKITPKTKAIMAVAWAGTPPQLIELECLCTQHGIKLILDAAHAFGAQCHNDPVHFSAHYTCYSFQAIKHFTTGDGGALVCKSDADHQRAKALKWFGLDRDTAKDEHGDWRGQQWDVDIAEAGYKFNMNNVAAAIGLSQLPHVAKILQAHRDNAAQYAEYFKDNACGIVPCFQSTTALSSFWVYTVLVKPKHSKLTRDELLQALNDEGIMAGVVHVPNDTYSCFAGSETDLPGVRLFSARQLSLPCGWWLDHDDIRYIATRVKELTE